jgi:hypothetical protein
VLAIWDGSAREKHESEARDGLSPVPSSKAARRTRMRKGGFHPPVGRISVPGRHWLASLFLPLCRTQGTPTLAAMRWGSSRGPFASTSREQELRLLVQMQAQWGRRLTHVFDQGYAGSLWLRVLVGFQMRLVMRWNKKYKLINEKGEQQRAWRIAQGKRTWSSRPFWDRRRHRRVQVAVVAMPVTHPDLPEIPLWMVGVRGYEHPWYLLTAEPIETEAQAWNIALSSLQRWNIEPTWRYDKSELAEDQSSLTNLGGASQTVAACHPGFCVLALTIQSGADHAAGLALALVLSSDRNSSAPGLSATLPTAQSSQPTLASLSRGVQLERSHRPRARMHREHHPRRCGVARGSSRLIARSSC